MAFPARASILAFALGCCACEGTHSPAEVATSIAPASGSGAEQVFNVAFSDAKGAEHLESVRILINEFFDGRRACYIYYARQENSFLLVNDSGEGSTRMKAGTGGELANGQCRLAGSKSSASISGNHLNLVLDVWFNPAFSGKKKIFLVSRDVEGQESGNIEGGSWTVTAASAPHDTQEPKLAVTRENGHGAHGAFTLTYFSS